VIPFGEYLPDQADLDNPGVVTAKNVLPYARGFGPVPALSAYSSALTARCQGAFSCEDKAGTAYNFAGDATKLYSLALDGTWSNVTKSGATYSTDIDSHWEFVKFKEKVIATGWDAAHGTHGYPQVITLGGSNFADLTTAFQAKHVAVVKDFVVFGNTWDTTTNIPLQVKWSGINDETSWTPSGTTLSDEALLKNGVQIQRIIGGSSALVFCETTIYRMIFQAGGRVTFSFEEIDPGLSIHAPGGICAAGENVFFLCDDGFRVSVNRGPSQRLGSEKVSRTVVAEIDPYHQDKISAAYDPRSGYVYWAIPGGSGTGGIASKIYVYNTGADRWSSIEVETEALLQSGSSGYTLEGLDTLSSSLDGLSASLDSPVYAGGNLQVGAFMADHKLGYFSGDAMSAEIETQELQLAQGRKTLLRSVRPEVDGGASATVAVAARNRQQDAQTFGSQVATRDSGRVPLRRSGRYHSFRLRTSGDFDHIIGLGDIEATPVGQR